MPRIRSCQLSRPAASSVPPTLWVIASLMRARFDDALAQHRGLHLLELAVLARARRRPSVSSGRIMPTSRVVEAVLDADQRRGDLDQHRLVGLDSCRDDLAEALGLAPAPWRAARPGRARRACRRSCAASRPAEASSCGWPAPRRTKMSSTSLTLARSSRIAAATVCMSLTAGRGQVLALLLDALVHRQQLRQAERGAHRGDARPPVDSRAADVIEEVVQQLDGRGLRVARLALLVQASDLAVGQAQQALDRLRRPRGRSPAAPR